MDRCSNCGRVPAVSCIFFTCFLKKLYFRFKSGNAVIQRLNMFKSPKKYLSFSLTSYWMYENCVKMRLCIIWNTEHTRYCALGINVCWWRHNQRHSLKSVSQWEGLILTRSLSRVLLARNLMPNVKDMRFSVNSPPIHCTQPGKFKSVIILYWPTPTFNSAMLCHIKPAQGIPIGWVFNHPCHSSMLYINN